MSFQPPRNGHESPFGGPDSDGFHSAVQQGIRDADAERIRHQHLNDEFLVRVIASVFYLLGAFLLFAAARYLTLVYLHAQGRFPTLADSPNNRAYLMVGAIWHGLLAAAATWIAQGLWTLNQWVHIVIGMMAVFSLLLFPPSIVIFGPLCFLLFYERSRMVCSSEYRAVVQATGHLRFSRLLFLGIVIRAFFALSVLISMALFLFLVFPSTR